MASSSSSPPLEGGDHTSVNATKEEQAAILQQELAVATRVRNRLAAQTSDAQLPHVLTQLVPRLLRRLEQNAQSLYDNSGSSSNNNTISSNNAEILMLRQQIQTQLLGTLSHCNERLRVLLSPHQDEYAPLHQPQKPDQQASSLVEGWMGTVAQELTVWESSVTWTVALSLLETALPSLSKPLIVSLLPGLMNFWENQATTETALQESGKLRLRAVAGLLLDSMTACMSEDNTAVQHSSRPYWDEAAKCVDGAATLELILDVFLFWPTSNEQYHSIDISAATGLSAEGRERMVTYSYKQNNKHFHHDGRRDDSYWLRQLKYAFARYIFLGKDHHMHHHNQDRILLLAVLTATEQSQHGRLASSHLNQRLNNHTTKNISLRCFNNDNNKHKRQAVPSDDGGCNSSVCSISLAVALLILLLGDADSAVVLQQYQGSVRSEDISCGCCWHSILGTRPTLSLLQRSPLPAVVAERVVQFLIRHFVPDDNDSEPFACAEQHLRLYLDLILVLQDPSRHNHHGGSSYWGIQLMHQIYTRLSKVPNNNETNDNIRGWVSDFYKVCLQTAIAILKSVPIATNEVPAWNGEDANDGIQQDMPNGVPQPFGRRRDLNLLLSGHRKRQQRNKLQVAEAVRARQVSYEIVERLVRESNVEGVSSKLSFEIPILLFQCASLEGDHTHTYLVRAMDAVLSIYRRLTVRADQSLFSGHEKSATAMKLMKEHWIAPLLPFLVSAACLDHAGTRLEVVRWTADLVGRMDLLAALHIVSYLTHDVDQLVAAKARKASTQLSKNIPDDLGVLVKHRHAAFVNPDDPADRQSIQEDLELKLGHVAQFGGFDRAIASIVLCDFDFSLELVLEALRDDKVKVLANSGVLGRYSLAHSSLTVEEKAVSRDANANMEPCGICYENSIAVDYRMACGHSFCRDCWRSYLQESFVSPLRIECPQHDCLGRVTADVIEALAPDLLPAWNAAFLASFTQRDTRYRHCTGPDCPMAARVDAVPVARTTRNTQNSARPVTCPRCDTAFCFQCGGIPHSPARCNDHEEWQRIFGSSSFWMRKNSKPCPSCRVPIEKNNGCNHMKCSQCQADFCWLCLSLMDLHLQAHSCNRYDPVSDASDDDERRSLFFTARFQAHDEAELFARDKIKVWNEKGENLAGRFWFVDEDELEKLVETMEALVLARRFLKWSYVAAWAMRSDNTVHLDVFQMSQATLELVTERLTQMALLNLEELYAALGVRGVRHHFVSMTFLLSTVLRYQQRIIAIEDSSSEL